MTTAARPGLGRLEILLLAALALTALLLRFFNLGTKSLWYDEAVIYHVVQGSWRDILTQNALENSAPPLYALLLGLLTGPDSSEGVLRILSAMAGTAAVPALYLLAREFLGARTAWLAPVLLAVAPSQVIYSQQLREYSLTVAVTSLLLLACSRFVRSPGGREAAWLAAAGVLGLLTQYGIGLLLTAVNLACLGALVLARRPLASYRNWFLAQLPAALVALVLYLTVLRYQMPLVAEAGLGYLSPYYPAGAGVSFLEFLTGPQRNIVAFAFPGALFLILSGVGLLAFLPGARSGLATAFCLAPIALTVLAALAGVYPYGAIRQDIFLTPMLYVCAALGADRLLAILPRRLPAVLSLGALAALALAVAWPGLGGSMAFVTQSPGFQPMRLVTEKLREQMYADRTRQIYVYYNAIPAFRYYWRNQQEPWIAGRLHRSFMDEEKAREQMLAVQGEIGSLIAEGRPFWVVLSQLATADESWVLEYLERSATVSMEEGQAGSSLLLVTPRSGSGGAGRPAPAPLNLF